MAFRLNCWQSSIRKISSATDLRKTIFEQSVGNLIVNLINIPVDPRHLQVNRRIKGGHWVPTEVKHAMQQLSDLTQSTMVGHEPDKHTVYRVYLRFVFPSIRSDIDGPIKRTLDAVFAGMRASLSSPYANDMRIVGLAVDKMVGEPSVTVSVEALDRRTLA